MALKRKRNLKVDNVMNYSVFTLGDLKADDLEDYIESRDTGMEADEEKEVHLQKIIQQQARSIPLPRISHFDNPARKLYPPKRLPKHLKWSKDCPNRYIDDDIDKAVKLQAYKEFYKTKQGSVEDLKEVVLENVNTDDTKRMKLLEDSKTDIEVMHEYKNARIFERAFQDVEEVPRAMVGKDPHILDFVTRRTLIRHELPGLSTYTCFRPRIFNPSFKPRRNESLIAERLCRMASELKTQDILCGLLLQRTEMESRKLELGMELLELYNSGDTPRNDKKTIKRHLLGVADRSGMEVSPENIFKMMTDRERLRRFKMQKVTTELYLEAEHSKTILEALARQKYQSMPKKANKNTDD